MKAMTIIAFFKCLIVSNLLLIRMKKAQKSIQKLSQIPLYYYYDCFYKLYNFASNSKLS